MVVLRRVVGVSVVAGVLLAGLTATPAGAEETGHRVTATTEHVPGEKVRLRRGPSTSSHIVKAVDPGTPIDLDCQLVGGALGGASKYRDDRVWDRLVDGRYVHDMLTTTRRSGDHQPLADGGYAEWSVDVPRCAMPTQSADAASVAADWAAAQVGLSTAKPGDVLAFSTKDWRPGPVREWSGDSAKFVTTAWAKAGKVVKGDFVQDQFGIYAPRLQSGTPRRGAIVYYPNAGDKGQAAIATGDGYVYTTVGADAHNVPISRVRLDFFGQPAGWFVP